MHALSARGVHKAFAQRQVLDGVDLGLSSGTFTLLGGRSGSGKSTLFSILATLERPSAGEVLLGATDVTKLSDDRLAQVRIREIGIVFQDFRLIPDLSALENVALPMKLARRPGGVKGVLAAAKSLLDQVGLAEQADSFPETLSGGEQQRVALARAMANDPGVVLADEPTANLDEENAHQVLGLLRGAAAAGRAVLVASHDPLARTYADIHTELRDGRLRERPVIAGRPTGASQGRFEATPRRLRPSKK